jgi:hypothetical protein
LHGKLEEFSMKEKIKMKNAVINATFSNIIVGKYHGSMGKKYSTKCPNLKYSIIMEGKIT